MIRSALDGAEGRLPRSGTPLAVVSLSEKRVPVTALPASNTRRYFLDYTINGVLHHLMMRTGDTKSESQASDVLDGLLTILASDLNEFEVQSLRRAENGSDVTNPVTWSGASSYGSGNANDNIGRVLSASFTGKDVTGHKIKFFIFGTKNLSTGDYRVQRSESSVIADALDYLATLNGFFITIAGEPPVWNQYVNQDVNDHWEKKLRITG